MRVEDEPGTRFEPATRFEAWRRRSATGALLTAIARGLREVFEGRQDPPAIVMEAPGEPPGPPRPVEVHLEPGLPADSWAVARPWLLDDDDD